MPPRRKPAADTELAGSAVPGILEARRRRRRRRRSRRGGRRSRSRSRRGRSRSRSRSLSEQPGNTMSRSPSPSPASSRASSTATSVGSPAPVRRKAARSSKYGNVNPFFNFVSSEKSRFSSGGRPASEVTKELASRWRSMTMEERQPYIAQAIKSREEIQRVTKAGNNPIVEARRRRRRRMRRRRGRRSRSRSKSRGRRRR